MRHKLFWKLGLSYLLLPLLVLAAVDVYFARLLRGDYERAGFEHLTALLGIAAAYPPHADERSALHDWAAQLSASGARVTLIAADGTVLCDSERDAATMENHAMRPEVQQAMASGEGRAIRHSDTVNRDLLYLARRVTGPGQVAMLRVATPLRQLEAAVWQMRWRLWGTSLVVLLLAGVGALLLSGSLARRVQDLKSFSQRVAEGDFSPVAAERDGDELSELAHAMNHTAARLKNTIGSLAAEKNQSAAILRSMVEAVAAISPEGHVLFLNDAFCRELHVEAAASEGRALVEVIRQPDLLTLVQTARTTGEQSATEVTLSSSGSDRYFAATAAAVRAEAGVAVVLVLHDISELRRLERVRRDFVANVSHEFKTPLTAIQGFAETLLGGALEDPGHNRRFLEIIREHSLRLARLTDDLLTLSGIEAGKLELNFQSVNVGGLAEQCLETTRLKAQKKNLRLAMEIRENLPPVRGDARRLAEILQNLLDNAVQYTNPDGQVTIAADVAAGARQMVLTVRDTGIGIPQHEQQRIFERFYRVDAARSREAGGTGLGLSIARHLAEAHGGRLEVQSEAGHGSTFSLYLPLDL